MMAKNLEISQPQGTRPITDKDVQAAKQYILRREESARLAQSIAEDLIGEAAEQLVSIAYKYNISPTVFTFDSSINEQMMDEVNVIMDELDEELYLLLEESALSCTKDGSHHNALLLFLVLLGHRNMTLRQTLYAYEWRLLQQVGALSAAMKWLNVPETSARAKTRQALGSVNATPELRSAFKSRIEFSNPYIRSGGAATYPDGTANVQGVPNDGLNAIKNVINIAIASTWMRNLQNKMEENKEIVGYYQDRGSEYPCNACDEEVGYHSIEEGNPDESPMVHAHCRCWRCPVFADGSMGEMVYD